MSVIQTNLKYKKQLIPLTLSKVFFITLHHTDSLYATPEEIHSWHLANDWNGAGYNEYIRKDGSVYILRGDCIGAHTKNMNSKSYGICTEGNYDVETSMPPTQFDSLISRINYNKARFPNKTEVAPHSKFVNTSCPGRYFPLIKILGGVKTMLTKHDISTDVKDLQTQLNNLGYNLIVDGIFGEMTKKAVKDIQSKNGLVVDGIVGEKTKRFIDDILDRMNPKTKNEYEDILNTVKKIDAFLTANFKKY